MRTFLLLVPIVVTSGTFPSTATGAQAGAHIGALQRISLDNGLQVVVVENHTVPLATVLIAVKNGAMTQEPQDRGLAHVFEHLLFRSYRGDPIAFAQEATFLDAEFNAATSEEVVLYYLVLPSKNVMKGISLLAQLVQKARLSNHDLAEERRVVLDELQRLESEPEQALQRKARQQLWGPSWSRKDVGGDSASLNAMNVARLQLAYSRYYLPNNSALLITGDVSAEEVFGAARQQLGAWARGPDPFQDRPVPPVAPMTASAATLMAQPVLHVTILVQVRGPDARDTLAAAAAQAFCDVWNDRGSPFQERLVDSRLLQTLRCDYESSAHIGSLTIRGEATPSTARAALTSLLGEIEALDSIRGVSNEDLAISRKRRRVANALALESNATSAITLAYWWASEGVDAYAHYDERVDAQGLDDLRRFAATYVARKPRIVAVLAPSNVIEGLRTLLTAQKSP
jgi:zinc protease